MTVSELVTRVRAAIDELMVNDSGFLSQSSDELNLDSIIKNSIGYALQHIYEHAPLDKLSGKISTLSSVTINSTTLVGTVTLPDNLLRIVEARLSSWTQFPKPESDTSQVYLMQSDPYAKGSYDRPVNILTYDGSGNRILEMYCAQSTSDTLRFAYIAKPAQGTLDSDTVNVPTQLEAALVYQVAGLAMVSFREDISGSLFAIAARYIGTDENNEAAA